MRQASLIGNWGRAMSDKILVTGSTGNVGSELVRSLLEMDQPVVAAAMDEKI